MFSLFVARSLVSLTVALTVFAPTARPAAQHEPQQSAATASAADAKLSAERLRAAYSDARAAVEGELGAKFEPPLEMRLVEAEVVARRIADENLPAIRLRQPDEELARAEAERSGSTYAEFAYAKYAWSTREMLVVPSNWERAARLLERPELLDDETIRAVLVHELVHALDDVRHELAARLRGARTTDAMVAINAVIEGHAQFLARRVCVARGWDHGFAVFTDAIGALGPASERVGEALRLIQRAYAAAIASAYYDGERFIAAVDAAGVATDGPAGGENARARAFREPPLDAETILHPEWWLDPKTRPAILYDPEPALERFAARFPKDDWTSTRATISSGQIESVLTSLPAEEARALAASVRNARSIVLNPKANPSSRIAIAIVLEFADAEGARAWIASAERIGRAKDESMKTGALRILSARYEPIERDTANGLFQAKKMRNGFLKFDVDALDVARGRIAVETLFSGSPPTSDEHVALAIEVLDAVKVKP